MADQSLWWRDGIIYQIYPRSFADSNGDGIGDLPGITSRLDYLADLGIDAIWLSPIFPSPDVDFGYDISDYKSIDPHFGGMEDFDRLLEESHRRGIRILLDLVLNHTSDQHPWFQASKASRDDPYRDWYIWQDGKRRSPPNNWEARFGGRAWEFDPASGQYYHHTFYKQQPDLNWRNPKVRQAVLDLICFWLEKGVDGFRLDVFNAYFKHPGFPDNPPRLGLRGFDRQRHIYDTDQPEMLPFLAELRSLLDGYPDRYAVGETYLSDPQKAARYCGPDRLHATFNFELTRCPWDAPRVRTAAQDWEQALGPDGWPTNVLNNHDVPRAATRFGLDGRDAVLKAAAALLLTLRGTPYLYYGEEIGMRNISLRRDQILDPLGKRYWPFFKTRDGCRAPMQWDGSAGAGFTSGEPWLPVHPDYPERNVTSQLDDPASLLNYYRRMIGLRRETPALQRGSYEPLDGNHRHVLCYLRQLDQQVALVGINFSRNPQTLPVPTRLQRCSWRQLASNRRSVAPDLSTGLLNLKPEEVLVILSE